MLIPFTHGKYLNLGVFFIPAVFIILLGTVNGANFTDGLDGLAYRLACTWGICGSNSIDASPVFIYPNCCIDLYDRGIICYGTGIIF